MKIKNVGIKKQSITQCLKLLGVVCLGLASQPVRAGNQTFNFDTDPSLDPAFKLVGNNSGSAWWQTGGNPDTGGYLELTPAAGGQNLCIVFPDVDSGFPVKAFKVTMDCRVGNGTTERPADGFSINFCREGDLVLLNAANGNTGGAAGGDSAADCTSATGSGDLENGTRTGVSIVFDAWAGNWWSDTGAGGVPGPDSEGLAVRVDDKTLYKSDMSGNRNGNCTAAGGADITGCAAAAAADPTTMQTGPWANDGGSIGVLTWQPLSVELDTNKQVTVIWKGVTILNKFQLSQYSPHVGRLVLMGRTGGNNQNVNFDNIKLVTIPSGEATFGTLSSVGQNGFKFTLDDIGASIVTNVPVVKLDGVDVTTQCVVTKVGKQTTVSYTQAARLVSLSTHTVDATWKTTLDQTLSVSGMTFKVDSYSVLPVANALPLSAVTGQSRGIVLGQTWQTTAGSPNTLPWTEEQILGLHGANLITGPWPTSTDILDYQNESAGEGTPNGNFRLGGSALAPPLWDGADYDVRALGFGSNPNKTDTDNSTIEWFTYVNFPTAGNYTMIVNSDDGFLLTTARNAKDRMGSVVSFYEGGRGNGTGLGAGTTQTLIVEQAGVYPIRGFIQNGGGGFNVEWYTQVGTNLYLVNSNSTPESLQAWQSATGVGCYVQSAIPVRSAANVSPEQRIIIDLANGNTTVNVGSIELKVNNVVVAPTRTGLHLELAPIGASGWLSGSTNKIDLTFTDSASQAYSYSWSFTAVPFKTLPTDLRSPLGSGNASKLGFVVRAQQTDHSVNNMANNNIAAESDLAGLFGPNLADLTGADANGNFIITSWINWDRVANDGSGGAESGNFNAGNGYPAAPLPGITATSGGTGALFENVSEGVQTYVEFPTAGFYQFGVNSDDNFKVTLAKGPPPAVLTITGPANKALGVLSMSLEAGVDGGGRVNYGTTPPVIPLTTPLVYLTPAGMNDPGPYPVCTGKIVLLDRGGSALGTTSTGGKIKAAQDRGAVGVIFTTPDDLGNVFYAGATRTDITIPVLSIKDSTDGVLLRSYFSAGTPVTATIHGDPSFLLGGFDNGRGATDTIMSFWVPEAGIYPMRMVFQQGGGGGNCEWFSVKSTGAKVLLNDTAAGGLKTFQAVTEAPKFNPPTMAGNVVTFTWTGTGILQQATNLSGSPSDWSDVSPQPAGNSYSTPATGARLFLRLR